MKNPRTKVLSKMVEVSKFKGKDEIQEIIQLNDPLSKVFLENEFSCKKKQISNKKHYTIIIAPFVDH